MKKNLIWRDKENHDKIFLIAEGTGYFFESKAFTSKILHPISLEMIKKNDSDFEKTLTTFTFLTENNFIQKIINKRTIMGDYNWDRFSSFKFYSGDLKNIPVAIIPEKRPPNFTDIKKLSPEEIKKLTHINGIPINAIEKECRPGEESYAGFLGQNEELLSCISDDYKFLIENGYTHDQLLYPLQLIVNAYQQQVIPPGVFKYNDMIFSLTIIRWRGFVFSPFGDNATGHLDFILWNLTNGTGLVFSELGLILYDLYGFCEGKQSPFRLDQSKIIEVFNLAPQNK